MISSKDYAYLSDIVYGAVDGQFPNWERGDVLPISPDGNTYIVEEVAGQSSGYYGVIFKNVDTGELVVSHCGTQFDVDMVRDLLVTDGLMALREVNVQRDAATFLVQRALDMVQEDPESYSSVSVTGHSLGGSLAQLTAFDFGLYGETFNAYGVADLIGTDPGSAVLINHVRVTDIVGAAGKHVGDVKIYAAERDAELVAIPLVANIHTREQFISYLMDRLPLDGGTHSARQFYADPGEQEFLGDAEHALKYESSSVWYDAYRAGIRGLALGLESLVEAALFSLDSAADMSLVPEIEALFSIIGLGDASEAPKIFLGTSSEDVEAGTSAKDYLAGQNGDDVLSGLDGDDWILGGGGNDVLRGGRGNDHLYGGVGFDRYELISEDFDTYGSTNLIVDPDQQGKITFDGLDLADVLGGEAGLRQVIPNMWESAGGVFRAWLKTSESTEQSTLILSHEGTGSKIEIQNWVEGKFGINLPVGESYEPPSFTHVGTALEDYINPVAEGAVNQGLTADGGGGRDLIVGTGVGFEDVIRGGGGGDIINGNGGKDRLFGDAGDDFISGFGDESRVSGGEGDDVISAVNDYAWRFSTHSGMPTGDQVWRDLSQYFGWQPPTGFSLDGDGEMVLYPSFDLNNGFDHSGASVAEGGWSYRFWLQNESRYRLEYFSPAYPDGLEASSGYITYGDSGHVFEKGVVLSGNEGNDTLIGSNAADFLDGGTDSDRVAGGRGNDLISGGAGADHLVGGAGDDVLDGGSGDDVALGGKGGDVLVGGQGDDILWGDSNGSTSVGEDGDDIIDGGAGNDEVVGEGGNDRLTGGEGNDLVIGGSGTDWLRGDQGEDELQGGEGNDNLDGGSENDRLFGEAGHDTLSGGAGQDELFGGEGSDYLNGGDDDDELFGEAGNDVLQGGGGDDHLQAGDGNDTLEGGEGNDVLIGQLGNDSLSGGSGDDHLWGEGGDDTLNGGAGADTLYGGIGHDVLGGGSGQDRLDAQDGNDILNGGADDDLLWGRAGDDELHGGSGLDQLVGGEGQDEVNGGAGDDKLWGDAGNDILNGGTGDDQIHGGSGNDVFVFDSGWGRDKVLEMGASDAGSDIIRFGAGVTPSALALSLDGFGSLVISANDGADTLELQGFFRTSESGHRIDFADGTVWESEDVAALLATSGMVATVGNDVVVGSEADDIISGNLGDDVLLGGAGNDILRGGMDDTYSGTATDNDVLWGGSGSDQLYGERGSDRLDGGTGADKLYGGQGADHLIGFDGDDELYAGEWVQVGSFYVEEGSDDILDGGAGNDILSGGLGTNRYRFDVGFGNDRLFLTERGSGTPETIPAEQAVLEFSEDISASSLSLEMIGEDLVIAVGPDSITVVDFNKRAEASVEFSFADGSSLSAEQAALLTTRVGTRSDESLSGSAMDDFLYGNGGDDTLRGHGGNDVLVGGLGNDRLDGGAGDDIYKFGLDQGSDWIIGADNGGFDTLELGVGIGQADIKIYGYGTNDMYVMLESSGAYMHVSQGEEVDRIVFADGSVMDRAAMAAASLSMDFQMSFSGDVGPLVGNKYSNVFYTSNSTTSGKIVQALGGGGDDRYYLPMTLLGKTKLEITENEGEGVDTVYTGGYGYTLTENVENIVVLYNDTRAWYPRTFVGNALDNVIDATNIGNSIADNRLDGGAGADTLMGGATGDTYVVDNVGDVVIEGLSGGGIDTVESSIDFSLVDHAFVENLTLTGLGDLKGVGNGGDNLIDGQTSSGANLLEGGLGNDTYRVDANDTVVEKTGEGIDTVEFYVGSGTYQLGANIENGTLVRMNESDLLGNELDNILNGSAGDNVLDGGAGNDTLQGGKGNDVYVVGQDDSVVERANEGYDEVRVSFDYTLGEHLEVLTLLSGAAEAHGNALGNTINGNATDNRLYGHEGYDSLYGGDGSDELYAGNGGGTLDGGQGADLMVGGDDSDYYYVDNIGDVVQESGGGYDAVYSSISYTLGSQVENLILSGSVAVDGHGNELDNSISGNEADNVLYGHDGNDEMSGGWGANALTGGLGDDRYYYQGGTDTIDNRGGGYDGLCFGNSDDGFETSRLAFGRDGDDLVITVDGDLATSVRVIEHFLNGDAAIDYVEFVDGSQLDRAAINALVENGDGDPGGIPGDDGDYSNVVDGTASGEQLLGSNARDLMRGLGGDDTLFAFGGDDKLEGGDGNDDLYGGNGSFSGSGNDILIGGAGSDSLKGEDGDDYLMGGAGDDNYYYASGSGRDTIDNTGGGSDYVYFASIARERLSFHRDGDDLIVRVDGDANEEVRVLKHFQGGEYAIAFVQPGDGGYAIPASAFDGLLTPMAGSASIVMSTGGELPAQEVAVPMAGPAPQFGTRHMGTGGNHNAYEHLDIATGRNTPSVPVNEERSMASGGNQPAHVSSAMSMSGPSPAHRLDSGRSAATGGNAQAFMLDRGSSELAYLLGDWEVQSPIDRLRDITHWNPTIGWGGLDSDVISIDRDAHEETDPTVLADSTQDGAVHRHASILNPGRPAPQAINDPAETARELDLLVNALCGYPAGAVTTSDSDVQDSGFPGRGMAWSTFRKSSLRGTEHYAIVEP